MVAHHDGRTVMQVVFILDGDIKPNKRPREIEERASHHKVRVQALAWNEARENGVYHADGTAHTRTEHVQHGVQMIPHLARSR